MITRNKLVVAAVMTAAATLLSAGGAEARSHVDVGGSGSALALRSTARLTMHPHRSSLVPHRTMHRRQL
jgi:hypothetical protein